MLVDNRCTAEGFLWLFSSLYWPFLDQAWLIEADVVVMKVDSNLKPNHHNQIL